MASIVEEQVFVEKWLRDHPDFTNKFVVEWASSHPDVFESPRSSPGTANPLSFSPAPCHGKGRTVKILNDLDPINFANGSSQSKDSSTVTQLLKLGKKELLLELLRDVVSPDFDVNNMSYKILVNALLLTSAYEAALFLVEGTAEEPVLVSRMYGVKDNTTFEKAIHPESDAIVIPMGVGIVGKVAQTGREILIRETAEDSRFTKRVDKKTSHLATTLLTAPLVAPDGQVIGVLHLTNKKDGGVFTVEDEEILVSHLNFCAIGLINSFLFEKCISRSKHLEVLLEHIRDVFMDTTSLRAVLQTVLMKAWKFVPSGASRVLLVDSNPRGACAEIEFTCGIEMVFAGDGTGAEVKAIQEVGLAELKTATQVAMTGLPAMLAESAESATSSKAERSLLFLPIRDSNEQSIGVAELINQTGGTKFNQGELQSFEMFLAFSGLAICNALAHEKLLHEKSKQSCALKALCHSVEDPSIEESVGKLWLRNMPSVSSINLCRFEFDDLTLNDDMTVLASAKMFFECGFVDRFSINQKALLRWVLTVKKNYRPVTYHNWRHAFNVAQTMFTIFTTGRVSTWLTELEMLVLLISAFCHDLDYDCTEISNTSTDSPFARLYSTSTKERNHFDHCIMILNSQGSNILSGLTPEEYSKAMEMMRSAICCTDLTLYSKKKDAFVLLVNLGKFNWSDQSHRDLFRGMLMTASDLASVTKPWEVQERLVQFVASEFFELQVNRKNNDLEHHLQAIMKRPKMLPEMILEFIDTTCAPLYQALASFHDGFEPLMMGAIRNREEWEHLAKKSDAESKDRSTVNIEAEQEDGKQAKPGVGIGSEEPTANTTQATTESSALDAEIERAVHSSRTKVANKERRKKRRLLKVPMKVMKKLFGKRKKK